MKEIEWPLYTYARAVEKLGGCLWVSPRTL